MVSVADVMTEYSVDAESVNMHQALPEVLAYSDETCRAVAEEMAATGVTSMQVADRETGIVCGTISAQELLMGRKRAVERESERNSTFPFELWPK
jgi:hypothetical protein